MNIIKNILKWRTKVEKKENKKPDSQSKEKRVSFEGINPQLYAKVLEIIAKDFPDLAKCIAQLKVFGWTSLIVLLQRYFDLNYQWKVIFKLDEYKKEIAENWVPLTKSIWRAWEALEDASNLVQVTPNNIDYCLQKLDEKNDDWANWFFLGRRTWELKMGLPNKCNVVIYYKKILEYIYAGLKKGELN